ncbi:hypothetical protein ACW9HQ_43380, partial [Nocardia gipuzkoensis]
DGTDWFPEERLPSRDNLLLSVDGSDGGASLWDVTNFRHPVLKSTFGRPGDYFYGDWTTSADGQLLAVPRMPGPAIDVWNLADPDHPSLATTISGLVRPSIGDLTDDSDPKVSARFVRRRLLTVTDQTGTHLTDLTDPAKPSPPVKVYEPEKRTSDFRPGQPIVSDRYFVLGQFGSAPIIVDLADSRKPDPVSLDLPPTEQGVAFLAPTILTIAMANHIEIWDLQSRSLR